MLTLLSGSSLAQMGKQLLWLPKMSHSIHVQLACGAAWGLVVCSGASLPSEQRSLAISWKTGSGGKARFFFSKMEIAIIPGLLSDPFPV